MILLVGIAAILSTGRLMPVSAQEDRLHAPVTALWVDADRLFIGRGETLLIARITPEGVELQSEISLKRGEIRDLKTNGRYVLALTETGLTSLDWAGNAIDFASGGGYRLGLRNDRVYVAALAAGVRLYFVAETGLLVEAGTLRVQGKAYAALPTAQDQVWVAEGENGVRLYEGPRAWGAPALVTIPDVIPIDALALSTHTLYTLNPTTLYQVDVSVPQTPRVLNRLALDNPEWMGAVGGISGVWASESRVIIGRFGGDALVIDVTPDGGLISSLGPGETLATSGDQVFIGSVKRGLRRISFGQGKAIAINTWETTPEPETCAPGSPQPADNSSLRGAILLGWQPGCAPIHEVWINGALAGVVDTPDPQPTYTFPYQAPTGMVAWQVVAVNAQGGRGASPLWRFIAEPENWTAQPASLPNQRLTATTPLIPQSPQSLLILLCVASLGGLGMIVSAAWWLGIRAQRRSDMLL